MTAYPVRRLRRLRHSPALRRLVAETRLHPAQLVLPVFVKEGLDAPQPIASMPGVSQHPLSGLAAVVEEAAAAGIGRVLLGAGCAQAWSPRVLRAGMGAHFVLAIEDGIDACARLQGYPGRCLATALGEGACALYSLDLRGPVAWLFGSEGRGLSPAVAALATKRVKIPMPGGFESLNVSVASGVALFEAVRQRQGRSA